MSRPVCTGVLAEGLCGRAQQGTNAVSSYLPYRPAELPPLLFTPQNPDSCTVPPAVPTFKNVTQAVRGEMACCNAAAADTEQPAAAITSRSAHK